MSIITATAAQRAELQAALSQCGKDCHRFSERGQAPSVDEAAELAASLARVTAALAAVGLSTVPATSLILPAGTTSVPVSGNTIFTTARAAAAAVPALTLSITVAAGAVTAVTVP